MGHGCWRERCFCCHQWTPGTSGNLPSSRHPWQSAYPTLLQRGCRETGAPRKQKPLVLLIWWLCLRPECVSCGWNQGLDLHLRFGIPVIRPRHPNSRSPPWIIVTLPRAALPSALLACRLTESDDRLAEGRSSLNLLSFRFRGENLLLHQIGH